MKSKKISNIGILLCAISMLLFCSICVDKFAKTKSKTYAGSLAANEVECGEYLSNLTPFSQSIGYGTLKIDQNINGDALSLIVDGERTYFKKGLLAHATSTLTFDIGESHAYNYFSAYLGIDAVQQGKGNVKFSVFSSPDNETWQTELEPTIKTSADEATFVKFSVENVRYLKFVFDSNGTNAYDHSELADAKLFSNGYDFEQDIIVKPVEYFNNLFIGKTTQEILQNHTLELMQRMFVENVGYDTIKYSFLLGEQAQERKAMLNWLYNNETALRDFVTGGKPNGGSYINALKLLTKLYTLYSADLTDTTALFAPETGSTRTRGDVYRTMMISIALTNAKDVYGWVNSGDILDPIARYEAIKYTYLAEDYHLRYDIFENLCVEEMRYLMSSRINSEEIYWLNAYSTIKYLQKNTEIKYPSVYSPHSHIKYGRDWNYAAKGYYDAENFEQYNQKYMLEQFGVHLTTTPRLWMAMDGSQICWGISYLGTNFASAFGVPSHYVRQPDHAAFLVYDKDENGRTIWSIDNDIFGWTKTWMNEDTVGHGNNRMMCDWGTTGGEQVKHSNGTYILLAATALDNQQDYENAELVLSLKSMTSQSDLEQLYRDALAIMPYHFDAWFELTKLYINTNKSDEELAALAQEIATNMYCFPLPMHELIGLITTELKSRNTDSSTIQLANVNNIDNIALQKATNVNNDENAKTLIAQLSPCVQEAKYLLGLVEDEKLATFSFDGDNKNKLVFNSNYTNVRYIYSLDGGTSWSESLVTSADNLTHELNETELNSITSTNDIYIWIEGWGTVNIEKAFKIDIVDGTAISNLEMNDNENKFFGAFNNVEYSLNNSNWQDLTDTTSFAGEQIVYVRNKRNGVTLQGETSTFTFTNNDDELRQYIPISNLELCAFSSEEASRNDYAKHAIDGKLSTRWHTKWSGGDTDRFITVKLNAAKYISGIDYTPVGGNGTMFACDVFVSVDGTNWTLAGSVSGWGNNSVKKSITFTPVYGQYVKIVGTNTVGGFCSARLLEFFEDTTLTSKQPTQLEVETLPKQTIYVVGQDINYNGFKAKVVFDDGSTAIIPNQLLTLTNITFVELGTQSIMIEYNALQTSFEVQVIDLSDSVARVGTNYYSSLTDAINAILNGDVVENEIELFKDVEISIGYEITKQISIIGNNHILTRDTDYLSAIFTINTGGNLTLNNLTIDGGAVWNGDEDEVLLRGTTNSGIIATSPLIKATSTSNLALIDCVLQNNQNNYSTNAQNTGGAIFLGTSATVTITNSTIKNCYSFLFGSAIYARDNSKLTIVSGKFFGNSGNANKDTTVICVDNNSICVVSGGEFYNNLANTKGGVFWVSNGSLEIDGGKFANNYATAGAGVYLNGSATLSIADFEEIGEIYLTTGKKINLLGMLLNKTLNIKMQTNTNDTVVAVCADDEIKFKVLKAVVVENKLLYLDGNEIKITDTTNAKASIKNGEKETLFSDLIHAINSADAGDTITLKQNAEISNELTIEKPLTIDFSNNNLSGYSNIKTISTYCVKYDNNLLSISAHIYDQNVTYTWSDDYSICTAIGHCQCGAERTETVAASKIVTTPASYESEEYSSFTAVFECAQFARQEKANIKTGEKLVKPPVEDDTNDNKNNPTNKKNNAILPIYIAVGVVAVGVVIFVIIKRKKKNSNKNIS